MPPQLSYPGVYIQELSNAAHTISGVARILSFADFERQFGGLPPTAS